MTTRTSLPAWPATPTELAREQERLASLSPAPWTAPPGPLRLGACAAVFGRAGRDGVGWAAAVLEAEGAPVDRSARFAFVARPFAPGLLALREGPALETVVRSLGRPPDCLLVAAAGRDHPRGAGLALHLGAALDLPTVGVTDRPLLASGEQAGSERAASSPLRLGGEIVAYRVRTRAGAKPVVAHAAWRTSAELAAELVLRSCALARWPEPLREARRIARAFREGRS